MSLTDEVPKKDLLSRKQFQRICRKIFPSATNFRPYTAGIKIKQSFSATIIVKGKKLMLVLSCVYKECWIASVIIENLYVSANMRNPTSTLEGLKKQIVGVGV
jgi:hypothetical protein